MVGQRRQRGPEAAGTGPPGRGGGISGLRVRGGARHRFGPMDGHGAFGRGRCRAGRSCGRCGSRSCRGSERRAADRRPGRCAVGGGRRPRRNDRERDLAGRRLRRRGSVGVVDRSCETRSRGIVRGSRNGRMRRRSPMVHSAEAPWPGRSNRTARRVRRPAWSGGLGRTPHGRQSSSRNRRFLVGHHGRPDWHVG